MVYGTVWSFRTAEFEISCRLYDEWLDPADSFSEQADIDAVNNGDVLWFTAVVEVEKNGHVIGSDCLGGCAYASVEDFIASHRDPDPMNRNCSIMRAKRGENVVIGHYFPDMVRQAIADARRTLAE